MIEVSFILVDFVVYLDAERYVERRGELCLFFILS